MAALHMYFLNRSQSARHKLRDVVKSNDIAKLCELLEEGVDPNMVIEKASGNRAVHLAATYGYYKVIEELVKAKANCDVPNEAGDMALLNSIRFKHARATQVLFRNCGGVTGLDQLWFHGNYAKLIVRQGSGAILSTLIIATPNLRMSRQNLWSNVLRICVSQVPHYEGIQLLFLTGYKNPDKEFVSFELKIIARLRNFESGESGIRLTAAERTEAINVLRDAVDFVSKLKKNAQSLKQCCRLTIRSCFHNKCNVYYGVEQLPIPKDLKGYLVFQGEFK